MNLFFGRDEEGGKVDMISILNIQGTMASELGTTGDQTWFIASREV